MAEMERSTMRLRGVKGTCDLAILNLAVCHSRLLPGSTTEDFLNRVMNVVAARDQYNVVDPIEIIMQFLPESERAKGPDWVASQPVGPILVSAAYCVRALSDLKSGYKDLAWANTADAMFWCGVANSSKGMDEVIAIMKIAARKEGAAEVMTEKGKTGAQARSEAYRPLRDFVFDYARRPGAKWVSRSHAAGVITPKALEFYREHNALVQARTKAKEEARADGRSIEHSEDVALLPKIREDGFQRTVDGWLKEMPDATQLFPSNKGKK